MPAGQPTLYDPKYCDEIIAYFSYDWQAYLRGNSGIVGKEVFVVPPMFSRFAQKIGVHIDTLHAWKEKHPQFSESYKRAKELQKTMIQECLISGVFSGSASIFAAKNMTDMRDEQHIDHTTKGEKIEGAMTPAQAAIVKKYEDELKKTMT